MIERPLFERVGVTATRHAVSTLQLARAKIYLYSWRYLHGAREFHHGDCLGGDVAAAELAREYGYRIIAHPPTNGALRAFLPADETMKPAGYLERDQRIVDTVSVLLALPRGETEELRSGTWTTIRRARAASLPLVIAYPTGRIELSNYGTTTEE